MNLDLPQAVEELTARWGTAHSLALLLGVVVTLGLILPAWHLLRRLLGSASGKIEVNAEWLSELQAWWAGQQNQLAETANSLIDLHGHIAALRTENTNLLSHNEEVAERCSDLTHWYNGLLVAYKESTRRLTAEERLFQLQEQQLRSRVCSLEETNQKLKEESQSLRGEAQALRNLFEEWSQERERLLGEIENLRELVSERDTAIDGLGEQIVERDATIKGLENQVAGLDGKVADLEQQLSGEQATVRELEVENHKLRKENEYLEDCLDTLRQREIENRERIDELEQENKQLRDRLKYPALPTDDKPPPPVKPRPTIAPDPPIQLAPWAGNQRINVGIDFGTHSTKIIARVHNEQEGRVLFLDTPTTDYPEFALPSLVNLADGHLFFGRQALAVGCGRLFRSLKITLLPPSLENGRLEDNFPKPTTPDSLVAFYLSWVLGKIKRVLGRETGERLLFNFAAPMNHFEAPALKERYLQVVNAAWQATFGPNKVPVEQGTRLDDLIHKFRPFLDMRLPEEGQRKFKVLPETLAPIVSLVQDPRVSPGFYMMVDMGGGTTEYSVNYLGQKQYGEKCIQCYADDSILLGGRQFQANDAENEANDGVRSKREQELTVRFVTEFKKVWHKGFSIEMNNRVARQAWKQLMVILAGGALQRPGLEGALTTDPPLAYVFPAEPFDYQVCWHNPTKLSFYELVEVKKFTQTKESLTYLAVANGLSFEKQRWPQFSFPGDAKLLSGSHVQPQPWEHSYAESGPG